MFRSVTAHRPGSSPFNKSTLQFSSLVFVFPASLLVLMSQLSGRSTNNSAAAMLDSSATSSEDSSSVANSVVSSAPVTTSPSFVLTAQDLSQAFSRALGDSLPQIVAAVQNQPSQLSASNITAMGGMPSNTGSSSFPISSSPGSAAGLSAGNIVVPSFISTYCTLGNSSLSHPSLFGSHGVSSGALPATSQFVSPAFSTPALAPSVASSLHKPFVVGPGYSPIPAKLVTKIRAGQFVDLADLLPENVKAQDSEPQSYLDGKLLVSTKKRVREITDIVTWVEAFTVYMWIFCCTHSSRWQDMTQYKLLILQTARQFSDKAWLHYDTAFRKDAAAAGLSDWSRMNSDLYNFHTRLPQQQQPPTTSSSPSRSIVSSSVFCRSWNNGSCSWPYGQCRYRHRCEKCEGEHPCVNCPFRASTSHVQPSRSSTPPRSKRQRH